MLAVIMQIWGAGNNWNSPRRNCVRHCLEHWRDEAITTRLQRTQRRRLRFVFCRTFTCYSSQRFVYWGSWSDLATSQNFYTLALFSVIYRPPDDNLFFERINTPLEKAWLRSENIFLLGDFNCDFSFQGDPDNILHRNTIKLHSIFESFNMHNMIQEATRSTISSISLSQQKEISSALLEYSHWGYQIMI